MIGALDILKRERDQAGEQIRSLRSRIRDLDTAIQILEGHPAPSRAGRAPGDLKQGVINRITELGTVGGTPKEIADSLTEGGRATSDASVSSTLSRLKAESLVTNRGGRWFAANVESTGATESTDDGDDPDWYDLEDEAPF